MHSIVRHSIDGEELYLVWSTVVDAPVTGAGTLVELKEYWRDEYGRRGLKELERDIAKDPSWCSPVSEVAICNRAGYGETRLTAEQIIDFYFARRGEGYPPRGT